MALQHSGQLSPAPTPATCLTAAISCTTSTRRFRASDAIDWSPRFGFSWSPFNDSKTVVSGGFGIFYDNLPPAWWTTCLPIRRFRSPFASVPPAASLPFDPAGGAAIWQLPRTPSTLTQTYNQISANLTRAGLGVCRPRLYRASSARSMLPQCAGMEPADSAGASGIRRAGRQLCRQSWHPDSLYQRLAQRLRRIRYLSGRAGHIRHRSRLPNYGTVTRFRAARFPTITA